MPAASVAPPGEDLGVRGDGQQQAGKQRRPGHDRIDVEVLRRGVVVAADRSQPVEAGDAHARRSCWRPTPRRSAASATSKPSVRATPWACSTRRPLRSSFSIGHQRAIASKSTVTSGISIASAMPRMAASAVSSASRAVARTSTSSVHVSATTLGRVPPRMRPTLTVTSGQRPLRSCRSRDDAGRLEDRAATLLGLDAGVRRPAVDDDAQVEDPLARRHDVAVRPRALEHERDVDVGGGRLDVRRRGRRADLLVGVGDEDQALERQAAAFGDDRLERVEPGQQPRLHVGHAGAVGDAVLDAERALGRGPRIEDRVHVADEQGARAARPAVERGDDRVAEPAGRVRPDLDRRRPARSGTPRPSGPPR